MTTNEFQYQLIDLHEPLLSFAYKLTSDRDEAKDLVQETFLKALNNSEKFLNGSNLKAWTYTILKNTFINDYRKSLRHNTYSDQTTEGSYLHKIQANNSENPDTIFSSKELEIAIESLAECNRIPFKMHHAGF